ncbi:para-aminobenzoate synthase [Morchella conica CCBAS932]|uniref:aminodeoxychorismate synthase n=1 Tax=Morchella conica CCBAS932 TaxID=1392247 RepID=A0A3N4L040_9PEZI|nr:para-aminobenzoate synthase [Morchella conica CCBAS932]
MEVDGGRFWGGGVLEVLGWGGVEEQSVMVNALRHAYDSFTSNLASLLRTTTSATVHTLHIDALPLPTLLQHLPSFDALVIGPGPGHPANPTDIGLAADIWHLSEQHLLPVLGVCLGHQSLCLASGATVHPLPTVKHGLVSPLTHSGTDLFRGIGASTVRAVRYHSLHAVLPPDDSSSTPQLEALAWAHDAENGRVLMAVRHTAKPFWGVQYHPESICTAGGGGAEVVANWWRLACEWNRSRGRSSMRAAGGLPEGWGGSDVERGLVERQAAWERRSGVRPQVVEKGEKVGRSVTTKVVAARGLQATRVAEILGVQSADEFVMLDSAAAPGRWCIFAVLIPGVTRVITYNVGDAFAALSRVGGATTSKTSSSDDQTQVPLAEYEGSIWRFLAKYMHSRTATGGCAKSPFWGGLVGYFNYEIGVASLDIPVLRDGNSARPKVPDVSLAFAQRSIVIDGDTGRAYIQTLLPCDDGWLTATAQRLQLAADMSQTPSATPHTQSPVPTPTQQFPEILRPSQPSYLSAIATAQSHLASGNSYELCLTTTTKILHPRPAPHPWTLYTTLRARNPAPYAAYLRLSGTTLLSSSPERFLSWTRTNTCQLRPIKGTVRKSPTMTLSAAERILRTPKETAENLMIVDLIRHDLHRLAGDSVAVRKLMVVEEYAHVFQLVSVIEGALPSASGMTGFDVLAASLPPGSMTGAPKRRSVQLLRGLEGRERGLYSGVVGYWSVCGAGDWSVVIRSAVRVDAEVEEEEEEEECDVWRIGAGGAITALSVPGEEWEEMVVKAESALGAFVG